MVPRTRRSVARLKGPSATPQPSLDTQAVNTHGFPALAPEIYLEIISYIPSLSIPTPFSSNPSPYPEISRSRHQTLLSLSQTSRSLRRFFWGYLWQRIEVREGMRIRDEKNTLKATYLPSPDSRNKKALQNYAIELVRQLEIVTVRNPQFAQYVNYVDVFIGEYSIGKVLAELARCLSLFPNLHTIQIDVTASSSRDLGRVFERVFKNHSYPQIRYVFISFLSQALIASCPEVRRVGSMQGWGLLRTAFNCPHLEVLDDFPEFFLRADACQYIVDCFPHLRTVTISPSSRSGVELITDISHQIEILKRLNHLQTIIIFWNPSTILESWSEDDLEEPDAYLDGLKGEWIELAEGVLIEIQRRNNLEKAVVIIEGESETKIRIPPLKIRKKV